MTEAQLRTARLREVRRKWDGQERISRLMADARRRQRQLPSRSSQHQLKETAVVLALLAVVAIASKLS